MRFLGLIAGAAGVMAGCGSGGSFKNLVTFGDSYTDSGRLSYYIGNGGNAPPPGTMQPYPNKTASGGLAWGQFVQQATGAKYYNYAIGGATCSNKIISRNFASINKPFPSVLDDEIPSFKADVGFASLYPDRTAENTVYALWIGTNDLGNDAFLTDSQAPGTNITTFVNCLWEVFDNIYQTGGRRFVILNQAPLQLSPQYKAQSNGGAGNTQFWKNKATYNQTAYQYKMLEYTTSVNTMLDYGVPFNLVVKKRWPGATFTIFDAHSLLTDIADKPDLYLDAPANATGFFRQCDPTGVAGCTSAPGKMSNYLWYDELHPSERADQIVGKYFTQAVAGSSQYGTTYHS